MTDTTQPSAETLAEAREAVAQLTGIIEGTNSWRFLMRGDWDDRYEINGYAVRKAHPRLPWVKAFAVIFTTRAALTRRAGGDAIPAGMKAWPGGDAAPSDWDGGAVMIREGSIYLHNNHPTGRWLHGSKREKYYPHRIDLDIIAYTPKPPAGGDAGAVERAAGFMRHDGLCAAVGAYGYCDCGMEAAKAAALALPAPVVEGDSPYVAGPIWAEEEGDCFTAEIQISGGHYVVATVHGATRDQVEQRQRAIIAALSEGRSHG